VGYGSSDNEEVNPSDSLRDSVDSICERGILYLVLFILAYGPLAMGAVLNMHFAVIEGATAVIMLLWGVRFWSSRHFRLFWPPICWAIFAFTLYALARCQIVDIQYIGQVEMEHAIVYVALFFAILCNLHHRESTTMVGIWLILLAVVLCFFAFYQFATHYPKIWTGLKPSCYVNRGTGTYVNPNHFAGFLEMIIPIAMAFALVGRFKHITKILLAYAVLMMLGGLMVSLSRGGIIAVGISLSALLVVLLFRPDFRLQAGLMLIVLVVGTVVLADKAEQSKHRFAQMIENGKFDNDRFRYWDMASKLYKTDPIWGIDPGHYNYKFWRVHPHDLLERPEYVHNDYLQALCEWGIVGITLMGFVVLTFLFGLYFTWPHVRRDTNELGKKNRNSTKTAVFLGCSFGLLAIAIHSYVDFNLHIPANAIIAVTLLALVSAQLRFATERYWKNPGLIGRVLMTGTACFTALFLFRVMYTKGVEGMCRLKAERIQTCTAERLALLKQAASVEPKNFETAYLIGEHLRALSWSGDKNYKKQAYEALRWFSLAMALNPHDPLCPMRYGMCLDWLDREKEATFYFKKACELQPNGTYVAAYEGWHYIQLGDYAAAKKSLERSNALYWNKLASNLLKVVEERTAERKGFPQKN